MEYKDIEVLAMAAGIPQDIDPETAMHVLALKGLLSEFNSKNITKQSATMYKNILRALHEQPQKDKQQEECRRKDMLEESNLEDKIRLTNLHHCNPYALAIQLAKCVSLLKNDQMMFYEQFKTDCYEIHGRTLLDPRPLEAEREELEADIAKLEKWIAETKDDVHGNNLRRRAINNMKERLAAITPQEKKKNPFE